MSYTSMRGLTNQHQLEAFHFSTCLCGCMCVCMWHNSYSSEKRIESLVYFYNGTGVPNMHFASECISLCPLAAGSIE